jgi:F-type H+-transporting ATPase subunit a
MHEIPRRVLFRLPTFLGVDWSVTNEVLILWASAALTFAVLFAAFRGQDLVPRGTFRGLFDAIGEFVQVSIVRENLGDRGRAWAPFLMTLFFFILLSGFVGMLPLPSYVKAMTANLNVTGALALTVFGVTIFIGIRAHGLGGFLKQFMPSGVPWWLGVLLIPIELLSWLARPVSLAVRLFANMLVGHALILVFAGLTATVAWFFKPLPFFGALVVSAFEIFVCFIQAFIFTLLSGLYIREALEAH